MQLAGLGFVGIYCGLYVCTYVGPAGEINHVFEGQHISSFSDPETGGAFDVVSFVSFDVENRGTTFFGIGPGGQNATRRAGRSRVGAARNWIDSGLEGIGFLVGGLLIGPSLLGGRSYCESCRRCFKEKWLFCVNLAHLPETLARVESCLDSASGLLQLPEYGNAADAAAHARFELSYCPSCYSGALLIKRMQPDDDETPQEVTIHRRTIKLTADVVHGIVSEDATTPMACADAQPSPG